MKLARLPCTPLVRDARGVAYVEFLVAFMPVFLLFLGITQVAMLFAADRVVHHAAYRAARSASVVLDDDPRYYGGEARLELTGRPAQAHDLVHRISRAGAGGTEIGTGVPQGSPLSRRAAIEMSAALVLMPLASRPELDTIKDALATNGINDAIGRTLRKTRVTIERPVPMPDSAIDEGSVERVTVRVRYAFACGVPLARSLVCRDAGTRPIEVEMTLPIHRAGLAYDGGEWGAP